MSKWGKATAKERLSAPASIFCGPNRSFPVADQEDFDNAVSALGRAKGDMAPIKACMMGKAKANNWTLPQAWMTAGIPVAAFALDTADVRPDTVVRRGKIFESGEYADKQFTATIEDLFVAASAFVPVHNDLEHTPTILDGQLGTLNSVTLADDGALYGEVEIPRWLHDAIGDAPLKTSVAWDRAAMQIVGNALVIEPRVTDAALMSAYAAFTASPPPLHDGDRSIAQPPQSAVAAAASNILAQLHNLATWSATPTPARAALPDGRPPQTTPAPERAEEAPVSFGQSDEYKAMQAKIDALTADNAARSAREEERERTITAERAAAWADAEIAAFRALPAERVALVAAYTDAATDDRAAPRVVTFTVGETAQEGTRVQALQARQSARTPHTLTREQLPDGTVLMAQRPANSGNGKMTPERKAQLLALAGFPPKN